MEQSGEQKTVCVPLGNVRIDNREIEAGVVKGLTDAGYTVNVVPGVGLDERGKLMQEGSIITVYRKVVEK